MRTAAASAVALLLAGGCAAPVLELDRRGDRKLPERIAIVTRASRESADGCSQSLRGRGQLVQVADLVSAMTSPGGFFATLAARQQAQAVITLKVEVFVHAPKRVAFVTAEWIDPPSGEILALSSLEANPRDELSQLEAGKRACAALLQPRR